MNTLIIQKEENPEKEQVTFKSLNISSVFELNDCVFLKSSEIAAVLLEGEACVLKDTGTILFDGDEIPDYVWKNPVLSGR